MASEHARRLRKTMSGAERRLWARLRGGQLGGHRFRRQHPLGAFVVDFVCLAERLVIEVDGSHHVEPRQVAHDAARTQWLLAEGYRAVRFPTTQVHGNLDGVVSMIAGELGAGGSVPGAGTPTSERHRT